MNNTTPLLMSDTSDTSDLRSKAEKKAALSPDNNKSLSLKETQLMIHELRVHQIELEMQNEELRQAQEELNASRARYFDLYDLAPVGYLTLNEAGLIQEANLTASTQLGVLRSRLVGQAISKFILKDDEDTYYLFRKRLLTTGEPQTCDLRMVKNDCSPFWVHLSATLALNADHAPVCRLVLVDITERKRAEAALQASEVQLLEILESTADGILAVDNEGKVVKANSRFAELWRVPESLLKSRDDNALLAFVVKQLSEPEAFLRKVQSLYKSDAIDMDIIVFNDGRIFERYSIPMLMAGSVSGRVWSFRDITERKRAEQELQNMMEDMRAENEARKQAELVAQREEALSNTIIDSIPGAFFLLDENGNLARSNSYHRDAILGLTGDQVASINAIDTIHPEDRALIQSKMVNVLRDGKDEMVEGRVLLRGGPDFIWMLLTGRRLMIKGRPFLVGTGIDITERKQAEMALRIKENQYRELFESGADALILIVISTGKIIDANRMASVLYGYERDELLAKLSTELSAEPDETKRCTQEALNQPGKVFNIPLRLHRKKDGTVFPVEITARAFLQDGEPVLLVSCRDITERERVEAELLAEKMNSEAMFESSPIALFVLDDKTNIVRVNGKAIVLFGGRALTALQHRPGNALGCVHSSEDPRGCGYSPNCPLCPVRNGIESLLANGGEICGVDMALDLIRAGVPQKVWMEIGAKFVQIEGRRHVCIAMVDITARKQADAALEKQNTLLTTLLNNLQIGVYMVEVPSGKLMMENKASCNLLGRTMMPESDVTKLFKAYDVYKSDTNEPYPNEEMPIVVAMRGISKHVDDMTVVKPDGTRVALEVFGSPIKDSQGNIWASLVSFHDISVRKQAEVAVVKLAKVKSKFTSVVSHELRSPLATIKEATNLVLEGVLGPVNDEQKDMLITAKTNIDRLSRLVNDVLTYQKMDTGKMLYDFQKNAVNDVVKEASKSAVLFAGERKKDLVVELGENLPEIIFDKDKILQVMVNLIANGIKYSESGPVVIKTCLKNSEIQFSVQDSGQGIFLEEENEIFKPFSHGIGRKKGGTGLGLAISKEIVLEHQGRIWVESEIGKGSTFHFTLPVEDTGKT